MWHFSIDVHRRRVFGMQIQKECWYQDIQAKLLLLWYVYNESMHLNFYKDIIYIATNTCMHTSTVEHWATIIYIAT